MSANVVPNSPEELLAKVESLFFSELHKPRIRKLTSYQKTLGKLYESSLNLFVDLFNKLEEKYPSKKLKDGNSVHATMTNFYLKGRGDPSKKLERFGHVLPIAGLQPITDEQLARAAQKALITDGGFPWLGQDGCIRQDPRLQGVNFDVIDVIHVSRQDPVASYQDFDSPVVIVSDTDESKACQVLKELISKRPFVFIVKDYKEFSSIHLICNHEYLDGVPAAYYTARFAAELGKELSDLTAPSLPILNEILKDADDRENCLGKGAGFDVRSTCLSPDLVHNMIQLYRIVDKRLRDQYIYLPFVAFIELLVMRLNTIENDNIRGRTMKFRPALNEQLDYCAIGNGSKIFNLILNGSEHLTEDLLKEGVIFRKKSVSKAQTLQMIDSHPQEKGMCKPYLPLIRNVPSFLFPIMFSALNILGIYSSVTAQVVVSVLSPNVTIKTNNGKPITLKLGGFCSPAVTQYMDAFYSFCMDGPDIANGDVRQIVVREKLWKEDHPST